MLTNDNRLKPEGFYLEQPFECFDGTITDIMAVP